MAGSGAGLWFRCQTNRNNRGLFYCRKEAKGKVDARRGHGPGGGLSRPCSRRAGPSRARDLAERPTLRLPTLGNFTSTITWSLARRLTYFVVFSTAVTSNSLKSRRATHSWNAILWSLSVVKSTFSRFGSSSTTWRPRAVRTAPSSAGPPAPSRAVPPSPSAPVPRGWPSRSK